MTEFFIQLSALRNQIIFGLTRRSRRDWPRLGINRTMSPRLSLNLFHSTFTTLRMSLPRNPLTLFQDADVGIMASNSFQDQNPLLVKFTHCPQMNKRSLTSSLKNIWPRDGFALQNHLWLPPSFLSKRRMEVYAPSRTIGNSTW